MSEHHTLVSMLFFIIYASISLTLTTSQNIFYSLEEGHELFETFIKEHNKQYEGKEKEERFQIFLENLKDINSLNEQSSTAVFGISKYTDLTKDEFIQTYTGFKRNENLMNRRNEERVFKRFNYSAPDEFDWRTKGVVSRVKDQGTCGSCWAFSASGNVESINAIKTGKIVEISEQQILDCDLKSSGCNGGDPDSAISYLVQDGVMSSESYPYEGNDGPCGFDSEKVVFHLTKCEHYPIQEADIKEMLYKTGPLSIAIDAGPLQKYKGGILHEHCLTDAVNHAVLLVGYGQGKAGKKVLYLTTDNVENGMDYWIVKNSWGKKWAGENGYFRMRRGVNCLNINEYGVTTAAM